MYHFCQRMFGLQFVIVSTHHQEKWKRSLAELDAGIFVVGVPLNPNVATQIFPWFLACLVSGSQFLR